MLKINNEAKSDFFGYLSLKNNSRINDDLIHPIVQNFFHARNIEKYKSIAENAEISDLDFKQVEFSYFYEFVLNDIYKSKDTIQIITKYCVTFDRSNCTKICNKTNTPYDEIIFSETPIFYFIYIDVQEIFNFLKNCKTLTRNEFNA